MCCCWVLLGVDGCCWWVVMGGSGNISQWPSLICQQSEPYLVSRDAYICLCIFILSLLKLRDSCDR